MITALENVPVISYIVQLGRCRNCKTRIPLRYPLAEAATAILFALAAAEFGLTVEGFAFAALFWVLVVLTVIDLEHKLLPNRIVYPSILVGWAALFVAAIVEGDVGHFSEVALGSLVYGGFFLLIGFIYPAGMGGGDIKLAVLLGAFLGWVDFPAVVLVGMFLGFMFGGIPSLILLVLGRANRKTALPFGPMMALGAVVAIFVGENLSDAYLDLLG